MNEDDKENDNPWKLGFIYYNPDDSRVMAGKRFGLGWTLNFAHAKTYLYLVATIFIVIAITSYIKTTAR